jgi:beta-glucosidase
MRTTERKGKENMPKFDDELLNKLTLEEKVALLAGASVWRTVAIERLGIPAIKMSDGPNGARGSGSLTSGLTSACFPVAINLAATWDTDLIYRVGQAIAQEAKSKGAQILLAPTVNIHRSPLNGRNFECYSEDPFLSARLAVAYINGVQSEGISATVKHFVCNDSEFQRNTISSEVGARALHEIYLAPFKAAIQEAKSWAVMSSYNRVNGEYVGDSPYLLEEVLRKQWGFDGLVMSDWFGTRSTAAAVNAGLDLEMPGPPIYRGAKLLEAVQEGVVSEATLDKSVRRLFDLITKTKGDEADVDAPEQAINRPEHQALIRASAADGMVLLKNERSILPLQLDKLKSIAIIGPNAKIARISGGGSARVNAHYTVTPYDGIVAMADNRVKVGYEQGCPNYKMLPLLNRKILTTPSGQDKPVMVEYFDNPDFSGTPDFSETANHTERTWFGPFNKAVNFRSFSTRLTAKLTPAESGAFTFSLVSAGLSRLFIDGQEVLDNWTKQTPGEAYFGYGSTEVKTVQNLSAGQEYEIKVEYTKPETMRTGIPAVRLGCLPPVPADALERAVKLAAESDVALIFAGLNDEWESESYDRSDIALTGEQDKLIAAVASSNPNTVVILNTGSPVSMPWLAKVASVLQAWYPGQECGNTIADVLFGAVNPSGKLPQTFPVRVEDNPAYINYPGENGRVHYGEGIFVGYRYYDKKKVAPLFPFGFGLSYTAFSYSELRLSTNEMRAGDTLEVAVDVTNTGQRSGKEIVQLYIGDIEAKVQRPEKELKGFAKVSLAPGETKTVTFEVTKSALAFYDDLVHDWVAEAGEFEVLVGASSRDIKGIARFNYL